MPKLDYFDLVLIRKNRLYVRFKGEKSKVEHFQMKREQGQRPRQLRRKRAGLQRRTKPDRFEPSWTEPWAFEAAWRALPGDACMPVCLSVCLSGRNSPPSPIKPTRQKYMEGSWRCTEEASNSRRQTHKWAQGPAERCEYFERTARYLQSYTETGLKAACKNLNFSSLP